MKAADAMPFLAFFFALIFSASSRLVLVRYGAGALWKAALLEAALAMAFLWTIGWAQTPESPLIVSVLMIAVAVSAITATVHALASQRPTVTILSASIAGVIGTYTGILVAYVVLVYTT
jgi:hypothetical protein